MCSFTTRFKLYEYRVLTYSACQLRYMYVMFILRISMSLSRKLMKQNRAFSSSKGKCSVRFAEMFSIVGLDSI